MICINNWNPHENPLMGFFVSYMIVLSPMFLYHFIKMYRFLFSKKVKMIYWGMDLTKTCILTRPVILMIKQNSIVFYSLTVPSAYYRTNKINLLLIKPEIENLFEKYMVYSIYFKYGINIGSEYIEIYNDKGKNLIKEIDKIIEDWTK